MTKAKRIRLIIGIVLIVLAVAFTLITAITMRQRIDRADEAMKPLLWRGLRNDVIVGVGFLIVAVGITFGIMPAGKPLAVKILCCTVFGIGILITAEALFLSGRTIISSSERNADPDARCMVVLGTVLNEDKTAPVDLSARLDTAAAWYKDHTDLTVIVANNSSDGSGDGSSGGSSKAVSTTSGSKLPGRTSKKKGNTTTAVMSALLQDLGIPKESIVSEDQSRTLAQCFENILAMEEYDENTPIILVTNNCFMNEAVRTAEAAGFKNVTRLPAPAGFWEFGTNILWEAWLTDDMFIQST